MKTGTAVITKNGERRDKKPEVLDDLKYVYSTCLEMIRIKTNNEGRKLSSRELLQAQKGFQMLKKYNESVLNKMLENGIISDMHVERFELMLEEKEKSVQEGIEQQMMEKENYERTDAFSFKQKIAKFMQDKSLFMGLPVVKRFVDRNLNALPSYEEGTTRTISEGRERFIREISNNGQYRGKSPQIETNVGERVVQTRYSEHDENESR